VKPARRGVGPFPRAATEGSFGRRLWLCSCRQEQEAVLLRAHGPGPL